MKRAFLTCLALVLFLTPHGSALAHLLVVIDKAAQQMAVYVDGEERYRWPVSTGAPAYSTPSGSFVPFRLEEDHFSEEWDDAPMPHSIFFTQKGHAIHGTPKTRGLGAAVSHGCVRLAPANAAELFALVTAHGLNETSIEIVGTEQISARR
jgi:lipoprotein-anchoring transpeptidase ErfK/SrfK